MTAVRASLAADASLSEAASAFFPGRSFDFAPTSGGVNNIVVYLNVKETATQPAEQRVLRVYNNGANTARVRYEHAVLKALAAETASAPLSFALPVPLPAPSGETYVLLSSGAEAALFSRFEGRLPKLACTRAIGRASGELTVALGRVAVDLPPPTAPYWDIYRVHRSVTRELFHEAVAGAAFEAVREPTAFLVESLHAVEASLTKLKSLGLPEQLIHGDLHYDNTLVLGGEEEGDDGVVTALLDFEFSALDFRAMELAICLSKYISADDPLPFLTSFIDGYTEKMKLTRTEIEAIPDLINLRIVSNVVYFVGRAIAGEDGIESLTTRCEE